MFVLRSDHISVDQYNEAPMYKRYISKGFVNLCGRNMRGQLMYKGVYSTVNMYDVHYSSLHCSLKFFAHKIAAVVRPEGTQLCF